MSKDLILGIEVIVPTTLLLRSSIATGMFCLRSSRAKLIFTRTGGGVYPEFASRAHALTVIPTIERALAEANVKGPDLKAIGVTRGPGLIGSLIVGVNGRRLGIRLERSGARHQSPARASSQR